MAVAASREEIYIGNMEMAEVNDIRLKDCVRWLWNVSKGYRFPILWSGIIGVLHVGISLFFVYICKLLIDVATGHLDGSLLVYIGWMLFCMALQLLLSVVRSRLSSRTEIRLRNELQERLFTHLLGIRWDGRDRFHTGDVLNRLEGDVSTVTDALCRTVPAVAVTSVQLIGALFVLADLDVRLAGTLLCIMPVALLFSKSYIRKMRKLSREIRTTDSREQSHLQEHLQHHILIRTLEYTVQAVKGLGILQDTLRQQINYRTDFSLFSRSMVQLGFAAGYAVAFLWGIFGLRDGTVTFGMMTAFLQLVAQIQRPMVDLSRQIPSFIRVFTSTERLAELADLPLEEHGEAVHLNGNLGVCFEKVSFHYPESKHRILEDFTHDFKPGSLTAIIGKTGSGKSTLLRLILALVMPDNGRISLYNIEEKIPVSPLTRCNLSYVPQGNTLVSGTIRDNLRMGKPDATEEEMRTALYAAVAEFVYALPDGLDTHCGEQGAGISEGQAQRIAIARGLLRPGNILLLDEPSSSLDSETEKKLLERLSRQLQGKTLILITHREAIAQLCTEVLRMG